MKIQVQSIELLKGVKELVTTIQKASSRVPDLDNILIEAQGDQIVLSTRNVDQYFQFTVEAVCDPSNAFMVDAKKLFACLKSIGKQDLTIENEDEQCTFSYGEKSFKLESELKADVFIKEDLESMYSFEMDAEKLNEGITQTIDFAGKDDLRPVMSGVLFDFHNLELTLAATDAHKLIQYKYKDEIKSLEGTSIESKIILPIGFLKFVKQITNKKKGICKIDFNGKGINLKFEDYEIRSNVIDGKYPNYEAVIPRENNIEIHVDKKEFETALKNIGAITNKVTSSVKLEIVKGLIKIHTIEGSEIDMYDSLPCINLIDENITIGLNYKLLLTGLKNIKEQTIVLKFSLPNRAMLMHPQGKESLHTVLIMPVTID